MLYVRTLIICTISPKGIVLFWSCNKAVANVFPPARPEPGNTFWDDIVGRVQIIRNQVFTEAVSISSKQVQRLALVFVSRGEWRNGVGEQGGGWAQWRRRGGGGCDSRPTQTTRTLTHFDGRVRIPLCSLKNEEQTKPIEMSFNSRWVDDQLCHLCCSPMRVVGRWRENHTVAWIHAGTLTFQV